MKKIAITGPESTGKSWLTKQLAAHYQTFFVPEYARDYLTKLTHPYTIDDVVEIAKGQLHIQEMMERLADNILFSDTEMLVCKIWTEFVFGSTPELIHQAFVKQRFDLYLLCDIDLPWEFDPLREHPEQRSTLFSLYQKYLIDYGLPYEVIKGKGIERLQCAIGYIENRR